MGLPHILVFSALTGISFSFAFRASGEFSGSGINFLLLDFFSEYSDPSLQALIIVISSIFSVFFIFRLAKFFMDVLKHRLAGITIAALGFSGSLLIILAPHDNSHLLVFGSSIWILGAFIVITYRKKSNQ